MRGFFFNLLTTCLTRSIQTITFFRVYPNLSAIGIKKENPEPIAKKEKRICSSFSRVKIKRVQEANLQMFYAHEWERKQRLL